jgi:hypothetical protein
MNIFVTEEFISEVKFITKSKSHSDCEFDLIESIYNKSIDEIKNIGTKRLGGLPDKNPFLRKRVGSENKTKSEGYRLYFWLLIEDENVFLMFIHPKTGRRSATNITTDKQKELVKTFKNYRDQGKFILTELNKDGKKIVFSKSKSEVFK